MRILLLSLMLFMADPLSQAPPKAAARKNPYQGSEDAANAGRKLYRRECAGCHGEQGEGIGRRPPLATSRIREAPSGALEWVIRNGSTRGGMPSFSHLPEAQRWQIVTYLLKLPASATSTHTRRSGP